MYFRYFVYLRFIIQHRNMKIEIWRRWFSREWNGAQLEWKAGESFPSFEHDRFEREDTSRYRSAQPSAFLAIRSVGAGDWATRIAIRHRCPCPGNRRAVRRECRMLQVYHHVKEILIYFKSIRYAYFRLFVFTSFDSGSYGDICCSLYCRFAIQELYTSFCLYIFLLYE